MRRIFLIAALSLSSAACTYAGAETEAASTAPAANHDTLAFVQAACGDCHAVEGLALSPNPEAPRWVDIANREGLNEDTLANWLRDAHNYPEVMDFDLDGDQVDMIAEYLLTLQSPDYKRLPD
ncbi:c-type cytochrome [Altererythrobacter sp.]|uniref:c-type cytochrome n=1 Tax=Altererythrobacter sp. TaxID=1872480 RepID=UPI003D029273